MNIDLDEFVRGYVEAALWTTSIEADFANAHNERTGEDWAEDTGMLDFGLTVDDIDPESLASMRADCAAFCEANAADLDAYCEQRSYDSSQGSVSSYAGHDFLLTRNRHGTGFWDRGLGALGDRLTEASKPYGETYLYVGSGDLIYVN